MNFEVDVNGRTRTVTVEPVAANSNRFRVHIDGRTHVVDAVRPGPSTLGLIFVDDGGASHDLGVVEGAVAGEVQIHLQSGMIRAVVNGRRTRRSGPETFGSAGEQRVVAPMPGRVLRVLVAPGDEVAAKQPLVVVEAMKMENELGSPKAGRVKEVAAQEGVSVEAGRLLVVIE